MRQAIRVYAIVALVAMVVFLAGLWTSSGEYGGGSGWIDQALHYAFELQFWVLLIVPLGVLAASDAARAGSRGWMALLIALIVVAPFAAWISPLINNIQAMLAMPCLPDTVCPTGPFGAPLSVIQAGRAVAVLPVPIAALVYSLTAARSAPEPAAADASQRERRTIILSAIVGIVIMTVLGYLGFSDFLFDHCEHCTLPNGELAVSLQFLLYLIWMMLAALPVAIASIALAHAAQTGQRAWLAGWIALIVLALLTADLGSMVAWSLIAFALMAGAQSNDQMPLLSLQVISVATPAAIMLVALVYAAAPRSRPHAAALATA